MAFVPLFEVTQTPQAPTDFSILDTSTETDGSITDRNVTLQLSNGTYMDATGAIVTTLTLIPFPLSDGASILFSDFLPIDYSLSIRVQWVDSGGIVLYALTQTFCLKENGEDEDYALTQSLAANISLLQDTNYVNSRYRFRMFLDAAQNAVTTGNDISNSQMMLDLSLQMTQNPTYYF